MNKLMFIIYFFVLVSIDFEFIIESYIIYLNCLLNLIKLLRKILMTKKFFFNQTIIDMIEMKCSDFLLHNNKYQNEISHSQIDQSRIS